jgi:hypothetical protein
LVQLNGASLFEIYLVRIVLNVFHPTSKYDPFIRHYVRIQCALSYLIAGLWVGPLTLELSIFSQLLQLLLLVLILMLFQLIYEALGVGRHIHLGEGNHIHTLVMSPEFLRETCETDGYL